MREFLLLFLCPIILFAQPELNKIDSFFQKKEFKKAEDALVAFLAKQPSNYKAIELLGDAYGYQKKWNEAIFEYKKLVSFKEDNANYHYKYGGALGMKALSISKLKAIGIIGDIKRAFLNAAELDKTHIDARWALVELYMQLPGIIGGSKTKSLKYANELEALSLVNGYLAKGYIYEYDNKPKLAKAYYKKAIRLNEVKNIWNLESKNKGKHRNALYYQIGKVSADYNIELDKGEMCLQIYIKNHTIKDGVPIGWAYYRLAQIKQYKQSKIEALRFIDLAIKELPDRAVFKEQKKAILKL